MSIRANRFQKALHRAFALALTAALVGPASVSAATEKKQTQVARKAAPSELAVKKRAPQARLVAQKSPGRDNVGARKVLAKTNVAPVQRKKGTPSTEPRLVKAGGGKAHTATAKRGAEPRDVSKQAATRKPRKNEVLAKGRIRSEIPSVAARVHAAPSMVKVAAVPSGSTGERLGLRGGGDALDLNSSVALVVDQDTNEVLFSKNDSAVLPIASLTKLMTGLVIADANLPMDEAITITQDDVDTYKGSRSRLAVGSTLSRGELMHLALMSSENRAANALGRTFPGGLRHFVSLMNGKARELGMHDTRYVEPTGLMSQNQSSARDLATLVSVAYQRPILRDLSTSPSHQLELGHRTLQYNNSNGLIRNPEWEIGLQKTGYISEAGRCLVMQAKVAGRKVIMVFLDSAGKLSRVQDAERVRRWVEAQTRQSGALRPQG